MGRTSRSIRKKVEEISKLLDLDGLLKTLAVNLGGGEKQRVGIARALIRKSSVLLMDEPISHLDADLRARTRGELARLQRLLGITTVYVTHDQLEALAMSDRIAVMNLGVVQQYGTPDELYNQPANMFVARFIGEPPMNFIPCTLQRDGGGQVRLFTSGRGFDIRLAGEPAARIDPEFRGGEVMFGIRPIDFKIIGGGDGRAKTAVKGGVLNYEAGCEHSYHGGQGSASTRSWWNARRPCVSAKGTPSRFDVAANRFHLFDRKTEAQHHESREEVGGMGIELTLEGITKTYGKVTAVKRAGLYGQDRRAVRAARPFGGGQVHHDQPDRRHREAG